MRYHAMVTGYLGACYPFFCGESDTLCNEPDHNDLWSISGRSPNDIWAVGSLLPNANATIVQNLVESPAGTSGKLHELTTLSPTAEHNYIQAIAPVNGGKNARAVGWSAPPSTKNADSLIMCGSATGGWQIAPSLDPSANGNNIFDGILAFSPTNIWAVGTHDGHRGMKTFIAHYTG